MPGSDVAVDDEPLTRGPIARGPTDRLRRRRRPAGLSSMRGGRGVVAAGLFGMVLPQAWFRPGMFIATGSTGPAVAGISGVTRLWSNAFAGTGSTWIVSSTLLERSLASLVRTLGGSAPLAQRLWFTVVVGICAASVAWLALGFVRRPFAVFVAGAVAVLNPFHLTTLPDLRPMICIGGVALLLGVAVRLWRGDHVPALVGVPIAIWTAELANDPALLVVFVGVGLVSFTVLMFRLSRRAALRVTGAFFAASLFWLVPLTLHVVTGAPGLRKIGVTDPALWTWTQRHSGIRNVVSLVASWTWGNRDLMPRLARLARFPWSGLRWALPSSVAISLALTWPRRASRYLAGTMAVIIVLAVGANTPFRPLKTMLDDVVPGYWLFHQPMSKFGVLLVVCFALAVAFGVDDALRRWAGRSEDPDQAQPLPLLMALLGVSVVFVHPLLVGTVIPGDRAFLPSARVLLPTSWTDAGAALDALPGSGATLVLPLSDRVNRGTVWGYYGVDDLVARVSDRPAMFLLPGGYYEPDGSATDLMRTAETALEHGDQRAFNGAMDALGASYLAIRTDTTAAYGRNRAFANAASLLAAARRMSLRSGGSFDNVEIFVIPDADLFDSANATVQVGAVQGTPRERATALAATLLDAGTVITPAATSLDRGDGIAWVPRADETGYAALMQPGTYRAGAVPLGPALWRVSSRGRTVLLDPADRAEVNGQSVLLPGSLRLDGHLAPFALLVRGPADSTTSGAFVRLSGDTVLQAEAGASVTLMTAESDPINFNDARVGDCANADGLPGEATSGMQAASSINGVSLIAPVGSACVAIGVPIPNVVGGHRRWRLSADYDSSDTGAARTCLWLVALSRCADGSRVVSALAHDHIDVVIDAFDDDLKGARLILAADHSGPAGDPTTTVRFSDVRLSPVDAEGRAVTLPAAAAEPVSTEVDLSDSGMSLSAGNNVGRLIGRFDLPGDDCNRYDDTPSNVAAVDLPGEPAPAFELSADRHTACVSASVAVTSGLRDLTLNFSYRASGPEVARVALVQIDSGRAVTTERLEATSSWKPHTFRIKVPPPAEGSTDRYRLYLYADGPGPGAERRNVSAAFRGVRMSPSTSFAIVVLPASDGSTHVAVRGIDDRFVAMQADGDAVLVFRQAFADGWSLDGLPPGVTARHIEVDGWANGWLVHGIDGRSLVLHVRYRHAALVALSVWSLLVVLLVAVLCTDWRRVRSNRVPT